MIVVIKEEWSPSQELRKQLDQLLKEMMMRPSSTLEITQILANFVMLLH